MRLKKDRQTTSRSRIATEAAETVRIRTSSPVSTVYRISQRDECFHKANEAIINVHNTQIDESDNTVLPVMDDDNLGDNATKEDAILSALRCVWGVPSLCLILLIFNASCKKKLLLVERPGGGKNNTLRMTATLIECVWLVLIPLLSLTANSLTILTE